MLPSVQTILTAAEDAARFIEGLVGAGHVPPEQQQPATDTASVLRQAAQTLGDDVVAVAGDTAGKLIPLIAPFLPALEKILDDQIANLTTVKTAIHAVPPQATMQPIAN